MFYGVTKNPEVITFFLQLINSYYLKWQPCKFSISCDALCDLVPFEQFKNHTHVKKAGTPQNFLFAIIDEFLKTWKFRILKKWKNKKNIAGDIIILHMCTKSHNHMKCSSWDTELHRLFCHFGPFFALLHPLTTHKIKILKSIWRCQHFKLVQQKTWSYDVCLLRYGVWQTYFFILGQFLLFYPTIDPKN